MDLNMDSALEMEFLNKDIGNVYQSFQCWWWSRIVYICNNVEWDIIQCPQHFSTLNPTSWQKVIHGFTFLTVVSGRRQLFPWQIIILLVTARKPLSTLSGTLHCCFLVHMDRAVIYTQASSAQRTLQLGKLFCKMERPGKRRHINKYSSRLAQTSCNKVQQQRKSPLRHAQTQLPLKR